MFFSCFRTKNRLAGAIFLTEAGEKFHFLLLRQLNPPNCSSDLQTCALLLKC
jgi:hypothetical protein